MPTPAPFDRLTVEWFDGRSTQPRLVELEWTPTHLEVRPCGSVTPDTAGLIRFAHNEVRWSEPTRHGKPQAHIHTAAGLGGSLQALDSALWLQWLTHHRPTTQSWVMRAQHSWRGVVASLVALLLVLFGLWRFAIPAVVEVALPLIPHSLEVHLGQESLNWLDKHLTQPSQLSQTQQRELRMAFDGFVQRSTSAKLVHPSHQLEFRKGGKTLGPNAFALPGGIVVVTDELVTDLKDHPNTTWGVLAHELGHLHHRHGMQQLAQATLLGFVAMWAMGDVSHMASTLPIVLGQAGYSRDAEREADAYASRTLAAAGQSPEHMVRLFEMVKRHENSKSDHSNTQVHVGVQEGNAAPSVFKSLATAIASHPDHDDRIAFFREEAHRMGFSSLPHALPVMAATP